MEDAIIGVGRALLFALKGLQCQMEGTRMEEQNYAGHHITEALEEADEWFNKAMAEIALDELGPRNNVPTVAAGEKPCTTPSG